LVNAKNCDCKKMEYEKFDFSVIFKRPSQTDSLAPISVTVPNQALLLSELAAHLRRKKGFSLATLNLDHLVKLRHDPAFRTAYAAQTYITADGNPVVWLCRFAGQPVSLIPGSELVEPLVELAAQIGVPVALVGSTDASLQGAAAALSKNHPGVTFVARISPPMGFNPTGSEADAILSELHCSGAGLCLLALGAPKQEIFAAYAQQKLPNIGFASVGAGIDFLSGTQIRAPLLVRRLALEWLWRMAKDPRRLLVRYVLCFAILPAAMYSVFRTNRGRSF
jgi:N-acetylglucosaminyldiphosphoundecaprenol N-acetyl-beta-D-mannosaminyltransferase